MKLQTVQQSNTNHKLCNTQTYILYICVVFFTFILWFFSFLFFIVFYYLSTVIYGE